MRSAFLPRGRAKNARTAKLIPQILRLISATDASLTDYGDDSIRPEDQQSLTTGTLALLIFAAILAQVAVLGWVALRKRRRQLSEATAPPSGSPRAGSALPPRDAGVEPAAAESADWSGFRDFVVQRRVFEDASQSSCSFYLAPAHGKPLPSFRPGQYLTFKIAIEDSASGAPRSVVRCYSLSDRPRADYYRVTVKRVLPPPNIPDAPPGLSSNHFHDRIREGTRLSVKAPAGHFFLDESDSAPIVLVAGGIGITPMLSILGSVLNDTPDRDVWLYFGVRNGGEHIMKEHLLALQRAHPSFHLHVCYSRPGEEDVEGIDYQHRGHADIQLLRSTLKLQRYQFYVCGPRPMMETLVPALEKWGVAPADIHYESFGPASLAKREVPLAPAELGIRVTFSKSAKNLPWDPRADSLLEFAEAEGISVEYGCRAGSCGTCQTRLEAGDVTYNQQPDADVEPGHCLLCIAKPKNDVTLAA